MKKKNLSLAPSSTMGQAPDSTPSQALFIPGPYADFVGIAVAEANEQVTLANQSKQPKVEMHYRLAVGAFHYAVELAKMARTAKPTTPVQFVGHQVRLAEFLRRLDALPVFHGWPAEPGITFSWKAGKSTLDVAMKFSRRIGKAVAFGRTRAGRSISPVKGWKTPDDGLPLDDPMFVRWRDEAIKELGQHTLPSAGEWSMAMIHRDRDSLLIKMEADYAKVTTALDEAELHKVIRRADSGGGIPGEPLLTSWTQTDLDEAIRKYKAARAQVYGDLVRAVQTGRKDAIKHARKIFGRNAIATALRVRSRAMVSKSRAWRAIAEELHLSGHHGPKGTHRTDKRGKIGFDVGLEQAAVEHHSPEDLEKMADRFLEENDTQEDADDRGDADQ